MISILITSFKEPETIKKAISQAKHQGLKNYEIIVCAPDKATLDSARQVSKKDRKIKVIKDPGKGKPTALNFAIPKCQGNLVVLTDGDVFMKSNVLRDMLKIFEDNKIGAVTARVVAVNNRRSMLGFWAHVLSDSFHSVRFLEQSQNRNVLCSGYFYAIRKSLYKPMPENTLADDAYTSLSIQSQGHKTEYYPKAEVYVKYPTTLADWVRQKKRTAGRVYQLKSFFNINSGLSLKEEALASLYGLRTIKNPLEAVWFVVLILMKSYIWSRTFLDFRLRKRSFKKSWERVESTK